MSVLSSLSSWIVPSQSTDEARDTGMGASSKPAVSKISSSKTAASKPATKTNLTGARPRTAATKDNTPALPRSSRPLAAKAISRKTALSIRSSKAPAPDSTTPTSDRRRSKTRTHVPPQSSPSEDGRHGDDGEVEADEDGTTTDENEVAPEEDVETDDDEAPQEDEAASDQATEENDEQSVAQEDEAENEREDPDEDGADIDDDEERQLNADLFALADEVADQAHDSLSSSDQEEMWATDPEATGGHEESPADEIVLYRRQTSQTPTKDRTRRSAQSKALVVAGQTKLVNDTGLIFPDDFTEQMTIQRLESVNLPAAKSWLAQVRSVEHPEKNMLEVLEVPRNGSSRVKAALSVLEEFTTRAEEIALGVMYTWRYVQLNQLWNEHDSPDARSQNGFVKSLTNPQLTRLLTIYASSTVVARESAIETIVAKWGPKWYDRLTKTSHDTKAEGLTEEADQLSKRLLGAMAAEAKSGTSLDTAMQRWRDEVRARREPRTSSSRYQRLPTCTRILPRDIERSTGESTTAFQNADPSTSAAHSDRIALKSFVPTPKSPSSAWASKKRKNSSKSNRPNKKVKQSSTESTARKGSDARDAQTQDGGQRVTRSGMQRPCGGLEWIKALLEHHSERPEEVEGTPPCTECIDLIESYIDRYTDGLESLRRACCGSSSK